MKVRYKEDPRAWRKSTLLAALGLFILASLLRWRHHLGTNLWLAATLLLACVSVFAWWRPAWFRGFYRFSTWAGFWSSQGVARVILMLIFAVLIVPAGLIMRALGKDPLRLRRSNDPASYWGTAKQSGPLDRLF